MFSWCKILDDTPGFGVNVAYLHVATALSKIRNSLTELDGVCVMQMYVCATVKVK